MVESTTVDLFVFPEVSSAVMGQKIDVTSIVLDDIAIFDTDRSITGQEGHSYSGPTEDSDPPAVLANRLFAFNPAIDHVHVLSNTVSVRRPGGWPEDLLSGASVVVSNLFVFYEVESPEVRNERLREQNYNSTLTSIRVHNEDLWVMWVTPDEPIEPFLPGQYTTLGLGYWEPRADEADEEFDEAQTQKMARRSYSVSSSMIDLKSGELLPPHPPEVEFYIVKVRPGQEEIPALTPRIFLKGEGDRIYMSHKFTGRYTLEGVVDTDNVVFLSTGTGEAPQNRMTAELLRGGHTGRILNVVCVRYRLDLAYLDQQAAMEEKYDNYKYVALTTREKENENNKVYIQDLIKSGRLEEELGQPLDPDNTHVFLCGNPSMIGLPKWEDETPAFPEVLGVSEILHQRGFTIDHRKIRGNVHYEEYWKDRD